MMSPNHALISLLRGLWECDGPSLSPFGLRFFASYHFFYPSWHSDSGPGPGPGTYIFSMNVLCIDNAQDDAIATG